MVTDADRSAIDTARMLALDAVQRAGSGHPGTAAALAPVAHLLFQRHLRHDPADPGWQGRDRFVLSCGHASILLYTQLFLTGYDVTLDDLKAFRTMGSRTPGHPELGHTAGVEMTTGPLGQGFATAVGMAMALRRDRDRFEPDARSGADTDGVHDQRVVVLASDGDLQEGISSEAGALAGRQELDNLVVIYDDNDIQIEGSTTLTSSEDTALRFIAQGWHVDVVPLAADGDVDLTLLDGVLTRGTEPGRPHLVILESRIAWPAPNATHTAAAHGAPLGADEVEATRTRLGVTGGPFDVPEAVLTTTRAARDRGARLHAEWDARHRAWAEQYPELAAQAARARARELPADLADLLPVFAPGSMLATRDASGQTIQALAAVLPELWGGSADLAEPNRTAIVGGGSSLPSDRTGRNVHWGVREHAMAAAMNGITLAGGSRFFAGTFLVFSDYQKPAVRLAALMQLPVTYLWSHDSVALGADGPTHQPIEHLAALRALPGFAVVRPADGNETAAAWLAVVERGAPAGIVLARQPLPVADVPLDTVRQGVRRGAYVVRDVADPEVVVVATGSEVALALAAAAVSDRAVRVVSMPCREWFAEQDAAYREAVLPSAVTARVVVEAAATFGWEGVAGPDGVVVGIDEFGVSAPAEDALVARGMTVERVAAAIATAGRAAVAI
jgi:transketolase